MKKVLSTVLAATMIMGTASIAFAGTIQKKSGSTHGYSLTVSKDDDNSTFEDGAPFLVTYGPDNAGTDEDTAGNKAEIVIEPYSDAVNNVYQRISDIKAHVNTRNVTASVKKNDGIEYKDVNDNNKQYNAPVLTLKGNAGVRNFEFEDYEVELDITIGDAKFDQTSKKLVKGVENEKDITVTVRHDEAAAYSRIQEFQEDTNYTNNKNNGVVYNFDEVIGEESRIRANDYVDVYFKGNYGTDYENMRLVDDDISEIVEFFGDVDVDCYDFVATPKFASNVKVVIDADESSVLYEYNKKTGDVTRVDAEYESNGWAFETKTLGTYIVAEEEYEEGNVSKDESSSSEDEKEPTDSDKQNPGTGANDMVGAAAAMAVVSLVAAGAVAFKKASK